MFKKIVMFIAIPVFILALWMIDDELSPTSKKLLETSSAPTDNSGYFYLMGIMAASDEDPMQVGKTEFTKIQQAEKNYEESNVFSYAGYPDEKRLAIPVGEFFCRFSESGCYDTLFSKIESFDENTHQVLLNRYLTFITYTSDHLPTQPTINEPLPPYQYLIHGLRVFLLNNIKLANQGDPKTAISNIQEHIVWVRARLKNSPNLIAKMIYNVMLAQSIDTLYLLQTQYKTEELRAIAELTKEEMDMNEVYKREFYMSYDIFKRLDQRQEFFSEEEKIPKLLTPLTRFIYKPNMTINLIAKDLNDLINDSHLTSAQFIEKLKNNTQSKNTFSIRNIFGNKLALTAKPNYRIYSARVYNLNLKILMYNTAIARQQNLEETQIYNPYWDITETPEISDDWICMKGVIEDERRFNCLPK